MQRVDLRMSAIGGQFLRPATASWALRVSLSNRNAMKGSYIIVLSSTRHALFTAFSDQFSVHDQSRCTLH